MQLKIKRFKFNNNVTIGELFLDGNFRCFTLEDKVREIPNTPVEQWKIKGITAIPKGTYPVVLTHSNKFKQWMPEVLKVPGFTGIRIHPGNTAADTEGCILVGNGHVGDTLRESRKAFDSLMEELSSSKLGITLEIT